MIVAIVLYTTGSSFDVQTILTVLLHSCIFTASAIAPHQGPVTLACIALDDATTNRCQS